MIEFHKEYPNEIIAVGCHELGHWKYKHSLKMLVINMFYMLVIGLAMIPFINNYNFLHSFNIHMQSYVMALWLIYTLFQYSVHFWLKYALKIYEREREY